MQAQEDRREETRAIRFLANPSHEEMTPVGQRLTLDELVAGVTDDNRHEETDWGPPVGAEVW